MEARGPPKMSYLRSHPLGGVPQGLLRSWGLPGRLSRLTSDQGPTRLCSLTLELKAGATSPDFSFYGFWELWGSGPHVCMADTLLTEPALSPSQCFLREKWLLGGNLHCYSNLINLSKILTSLLKRELAHFIGINKSSFLKGDISTDFSVGRITL